MRTDTFKYTNKGRYDINEDSILCGEDIFAVADGLGGHNCGEAASACAVRYISDNLKDRSENGIAALISGANAEVCRLGNGACTTIAVAFVNNGEFFYAHIGDSRVYYFRGGKMIERTKDHSVCQAAVDLGYISEEEIRGNEDRSKLLKALGSPDLKIGKINKPIKIENGDAFLICSDGFWEYVYESEMENDLKKAGSAKEWTTLMLERHLQRSNNDCDNYSAVCGIFRK